MIPRPSRLHGGLHPVPLGSLGRGGLVLAGLVALFPPACGSDDTAAPTANAAGSAGTTGATGAGSGGAAGSPGAAGANGGGKTGDPGGAGPGGSAGAGGTGATAGTGGSAGSNATAGTGGSNAGTGGTTAGTSGSTAGTGGSTAGTGGSAGTSTTGVPPLGADACDGYATRYWDCCKAHCAWKANVPAGVQPVQSCNAADEPLTSSGAADTPSSCDGPTADRAFTCNTMAPVAVNAKLSYGYAAVPSQGDICGRCYQLEFTGKSHNAGDDAGSKALAGKTMIVQATNIGYDVGNGQFDVLIPGGGVGAFNACSYQWKSSDLGAQYGGFLLACKQAKPNGTHAEWKSCVSQKCDTVFADPSLSELKSACDWFVNWYEAADNPALRYQEVACPDAIVKSSGVDRRPLDDVTACGKTTGGSCDAAQQAQCDCSWTNGGKNCGQDDGSCCWKACCGK
jgi:hypothetical protein